MENDWKICLAVIGDDCGIEEKECEEDLQFVPRIGEVVFPSDRTCEKLTGFVRECWCKKRCKPCPFCYGAQESEDDIDIGDFMYVKCVLHDAGRKVVRIELTDSNPIL